MYRIEVKRLKGELKSDALQKWHLDAPTEELVGVDKKELLSDGIAVRGWVLATTSKVEMFARGKGKAPADSPIPWNRNFHFHVARKDVLSAFPQSLAAREQRVTCGFSFQFVPPANQFEIGIRGEAKDGAEFEYVLWEGSIKGAFDVLQGKDNWLFLDNDTNKSVAQYRGEIRLGIAEKGAWQAYFSGLQQLAEAHNAKLCTLIAPAKEAVLQDVYPHERGSATVMDDVLSLCPASYPLEYPEQTLRTLSHRSFRVTDTHWTPRGAEHAAIRVAERFGFDSAAVLAVFAKDKYKEQSSVGDLGGKIYPPRKHKESMLKSYSYRKFIKYDNGLDNFGRMLIVRNSDALDSGRLLLFASSSAYSMLDYLSRIFRQIIMVHTAGNVDARLVTELKPDYILTQTNGRFVVRPPVVSYDISQIIKEKANQLPSDRLASLKAHASDLNNRTGYPIVKVATRYFLQATEDYVAR